jgi:hypothetical protein
MVSARAFGPYGTLILLGTAKLFRERLKLTIEFLEASANRMEYHAD